MADVIDIYAANRAQERKEEVLGLAYQTKEGDVWKSNKTQRLATVRHNNYIRGVYLSHETGRSCYIQQEYLARDYTPIK